MRTQAELLQAGLQLGAMALIFGAFFLLVIGATSYLGLSCRSAIEPTLRRIRQGTSHTRSELADVSVRLSIALAIVAIIERPILAVLLMVGLMKGRPTIRRLTSDENRLLALRGSLSIDLVIGFYLPIALAQLLMRDVFTGASMLMVIVALSWPAGGGDVVPGRSWKLAPVR